MVFNSEKNPNESTENFKNLEDIHTNRERNKNEQRKNEPKKWTKKIEEKELKNEQKMNKIRSRKENLFIESKGKNILKDQSILKQRLRRITK